MLDVPYDTQLVDRGVNAQSAPAYRALNPLGMIPALETEDGVLFETGAILLWLADRHGALFPSQSDQGRGDALKWLFFISNSLHAGMRQMFYPDKFIAPEHREALRSGIAQRIRADFRQIDMLIADPNCTILGGESISLLDIYVCACLRWAQLYPADHPQGWVNAAEFTHLLNLAKELERVPAVNSAQVAEGLGPTPFSAPSLANPPIGSAT